MQKGLILLLAVLLLAACQGANNAGDVQPTATPRAVLTITPKQDVEVIPDQERPNFVFILTDDLDSKLGTIEYMPYLKDLLISKGLTIEDYFVSNPVCCPSRSTYLRGQYNHNNQVYTNEPPSGGFERFYLLENESSTLATWLQAAGYDTVFLGKYLNGYPFREDRTYVPVGWTEWYGAARGRPYPGFKYSLNENGVLVDYDVEGQGEEQYMTDVLARKTVDFIRRSAENPAPFFIYLAAFAPHEPARPAPRHEQLFPDLAAPRTASFNETDISDKSENMSQNPLISDDKIRGLDELYRGRVRSMQAVDEMISQLVTVLEETGQLENTYIIFTSDNGFHMGQHRLLSGKGTPYEADIRVPFIIRGPGIPADSVLSGYLSGNVDFAPTIAELAGVVPPAYVDGRSLVPLFGEQKPDEWRAAYLLESYGGASSESEPEDDQSASVGGAVQPEAVYIGLRTRDYLYVEYPSGFRELYDLQNDPDQLENMASAAEPELISQLSEWLQELYACSGKQCTEIEARGLR